MIFFYMISPLNFIFNLAHIWAQTPPVVRLISSRLISSTTHKKYFSALQNNSPNAFLTVLLIQERCQITRKEPIVYTPSHKKDPTQVKGFVYRSLVLSLKTNKVETTQTAYRNSPTKIDLNQKSLASEIKKKLKIN